MGQQALPTTLGLKAAGWLHGLDEAVVQVRSTSADLPAQLGGAVGTLASLGDSGLDVLAAYASALDLAEPPLAWHTDRWPVIRIAQACGGAAAAASKIAGDVVLLSQTEVAEAVEGVDKRGGSSTLPHKRNPVAAVAARAAAMRVPGLVATLLTAAAQEHERAAGAWHAEWLPMRDLLTATGSAVAWLADCLEHLEGDPQRARENLDQTQGRLMAERITTVLQPHLGRLPAHNLVESVVRESAEQRRPFAEVLKSQPAVTKHLSSDEIDNLLEPSTYFGSANAFIGRALKQHRSVR